MIYARRSSEDYPVRLMRRRAETHLETKFVKILARRRSPVGAAVCAKVAHVRNPDLGALVPPQVSVREHWVRLATPHDERHDWPRSLVR